tara:strand:- start:466 stop:933 length:468 start_codon:yes stop_codon:yes gene_type:complete
MEHGIPSHLFAVTDNYEILKLKVESAELTNDVFKLSTSLMEGKYSDQTVLHYNDAFQYIYLNSDKSIHARHVSLFFDIKLAHVFVIEKAEAELNLLHSKEKAVIKNIADIEKSLLEDGFSEEYIAQQKKQAIDKIEQELCETGGNKEHIASLRKV